MINVTTEALAKINLALQINGIKNDLHDLDMILCSIELSNQIEITDFTRDCVYINGKEIKKTNCHKAIKYYREVADIPYIKVNIKADIPVGAGLGSSSADPAAVLRSLFYLFPINQEILFSIAKRVGSDVPYMIFGGLKRVMGSGEIIKDIDANIDAEIALFIGQKENSTKEIFDIYDKGPISVCNTQNIYEKILSNEFSSSDIENDLLNAAISNNETLKNDYLYLQTFFDNVKMTGSGNALFVMNPDKQKIKDLEMKTEEDRFKIILTKIKI